MPESHEQLSLAPSPDRDAPMEPMKLVEMALQSAIASDKGLEVVDRIFAEQRRMIEYRDTENFNAALRRIQDRLRPIGKHGDNPETHSKFATAGAIDQMIDGLLQDERMTLTFEPEPHPQPDMLRLVGVLSLGAYSKRYPLDIPVDGKGPKGGGVMSRTHALGSGLTYGKRYLKNIIFNLRFEEQDDDGNGAGGNNPGMQEPEFIKHRDNIEASRTMDELKASWSAAYKAAMAAFDKRAADSFAKVRDARKRVVDAGN